MDIFFKATKNVLKLNVYFGSRSICVSLGSKFTKTKYLSLSHQLRNHSCDWLNSSRSPKNRNNLVFSFSSKPRGPTHTHAHILKKKKKKKRRLDAILCESRIG